MSGGRRSDGPSVHLGVALLAGLAVVVLSLIVTVDASAQTPQQTINVIENKVEATGDAIGDFVESAEEQFEDAQTPAEAQAILDQRSQQIADRIASARLFVDSKAAQHPDDPQVQEAQTIAHEDLTEIESVASGELHQEYASWTPPPGGSTPVTTLPTTTTTVSVTTTTTTVPPPPPTSIPNSTTTTTSPAAALPPPEPPRTDSAYLPDVPEVVSEPAPSGSADLAVVDDIATVGLVRRVVDSQLPAGVSAVAAGPLVVLGLIIDAVRAAGGLMLIPWAILGLYMTGLLRGWRGFTAMTEGLD